MTGKNTTTGCFSGLVIAMASNVLTEKDRKELKLELRPVVKRMLDEQHVSTAIANAMRRHPDLTWSELAGVFCEVMGYKPIRCPRCGKELVHADE